MFFPIATRWCQTPQPLRCNNKELPLPRQPEVQRVTAGRQGDDRGNKGCRDGTYQSKVITSLAWVGLRQSETYCISIHIHPYPIMVCSICSILNVRRCYPSWFHGVRVHRRQRSEAAWRRAVLKHPVPTPLQAMWGWVRTNRTPVVHHQNSW